MKIEGGCYCGEVRYSFEGEPGPAMQCHCRECQYITGGNPNVFVMIPEAELHFTGGELNSFQRTDIDNAVTRDFCSSNGTAVGTTTSGARVRFESRHDGQRRFLSAGNGDFTKDAQSFQHISQGLPSFKDLPTGSLT